MKELTEILSRVQEGNPNASSEVLPLVYQELRKLARSKLAHELPGQAIAATGLPTSGC